jgi:hypothetical protein
MAASRTSCGTVSKRREGPAPAAALLIDPVNQSRYVWASRASLALETRSTKRRHGTQQPAALVINQTAQHRATGTALTYYCRAQPIGHDVRPQSSLFALDRLDRPKQRW